MVEWRSAIPLTDHVAALTYLFMVRQPGPVVEIQGNYLSVKSIHHISNNICCFPYGDNEGIFYAYCYQTDLRKMENCSMKVITLRIGEETCVAGSPARELGLRHTYIHQARCNVSDTVALQSGFLMKLRVWLSCSKCAHR